jgi:hypothetical protein
MVSLLSSNLPCRGPRSHAGSASGDPSGGAFYIERFGEHHGVAIVQGLPVGIAVQLHLAAVFVVSGGFGPGQGGFVQIHHFYGIGRPALVAQAIEQAPGNHLHGGHLAPHAIVQAGPVGAVEFFFFGELPGLHLSHTQRLSSACRSVCGGTSYTDRWSAALHNSQAWPLRAIRVSSKLMFKFLGECIFLW